MKAFNRDEWITHLRYSKVIEWRKAEEARGWEAEYILALPVRLVFPNLKLIKWLKENITGRWNVIWDYWLEFENGADAMAFKLKWL